MKVLCVYHSRDLDGWMSAAIVKKWFNKEYPNADSISDLNTNSHAMRPPDEVGTGESLYFLGWDYGDEIPNLSAYNRMRGDKIIMCDIGFPKEEMEKLQLQMLNSNVTASNNLIWIDHHISSIKEVASLDLNPALINGIRDTSFAACELTWKFFFPEQTMPELVRLLGRYDCFGHKGTNEELTVLEFQYGARQVITDYQEAHTYLTDCISDKLMYAGDIGGDVGRESDKFYSILSNGVSIHGHLCTEAKQTYKMAFPIALPEAEMTGEAITAGRMRKFLLVNQNRFNPINFGIDYHKDGYDGFGCFWYNKGKWAFSLYNDNGEVDCSVIAKRYGGGGHKGAAGFMIEDITDFLRYSL